MKCVNYEIRTDKPLRRLPQLAAPLAVGHAAGDGVTRPDWSAAGQ